MTANWEVWKGVSGAMNFPVVSILRTGSFSLNPPALKLLGGQVRHVELLHDREGEKIGVRPVSEAKPYTRKVSRGVHTASVNAKAFLDEYRIDYRKTKRYRAEKAEDEILAIDLKEAL